MNLEAPEILFYALTAAAVIAWLCALVFMLNTTRRRRPTEQDAQIQQLGVPAPENLIAGSAEVAGSPPELAEKAAKFLAKQGPMSLGPVKILDQTADRVVFEGMAGAPMNPGGAMVFSRGELRFTAIPQNRTRVDYAVEVPPRSWLLSMGWMFVALGLLAIIIGFFLIQTYVANALDPAVRWQSVQMVHVCHFIWPPFLFGGIYRRLRKLVGTTFETLVHNLPYYEG